MNSTLRSDVELLNEGFEVLVASHEVGDGLLGELLFSFELVYFHVEKFDVFVLFGHAVEELQGFLPEDDEFLFEGFNFLGLVGGGVGFLGVFVLQFLHFFAHPVQVGFVGE